MDNDFNDFNGFTRVCVPAEGPLNVGLRRENTPV